MSVEGSKLDELEFLRQSEGTLAQLIEACKDCALFMLDAKRLYHNLEPRRGADYCCGEFDIAFGAEAIVLS